MDIFACEEKSSPFLVKPPKSKFVGRVILPEPVSEPPDLAQFILLRGAANEDFDKNIKDIEVDLDNRLQPEIKEKFFNLHDKYKHLFTDRPGRFNGFPSYVDNRLNFSRRPSANDKVHVPRYSGQFQEILAERMDELEEQGILCNPEVLGITVQHVSPSFVVPKEEKGKYRLVTDFSLLNNSLIKCPTTSPTIEQAKRSIAEAEYFVATDFSNFFYQSGLDRKDCQYLGTLHPFDGLKVYTSSPQGMKGSSESSFERLKRLFSSMIRGNRATTMADGLYILGYNKDGVDLLKNWEEALELTSSAGLTLKASKTSIAPRSIKLFGWILEEGKWKPTDHVINSISRAVLPPTVKTLRGFIGSVKQISQSIPNYAELLYPLEQLQGGRGTAEKLTWTPELTAVFEKVKKAVGNTDSITAPRSTDQLVTYSDYSVSSRSGGGRLEVHRKMPDGSTKILPAGFYSVTFKSFKKPLLACEGEAMTCRAVLNHFTPFIIESDNTTIHYTDSRPTVLAWARSQRGALSTSVRLSLFLTGLSALPVELRHKAGATMFTSDYLSRNPVECGNPKNCDVCQYVEKWQARSDNADAIRSLNIEDFLNNSATVPYTQRGAWKNVQKNDPVHSDLMSLMKTGQLPPNKKTGTRYTWLKNLHTLYRRGDLKVSRDGLILVKVQSGAGAFDGGYAISIPVPLMPGLLSAIHIRTGHGGPTQTERLVERFFYCPGWRQLVKKLYQPGGCFLCVSLKSLPPLLAMDSTTKPGAFGANMSCDVIERNRQKIFVMTENLSGWTRLRLIENQTADTLRQAVLETTLDMISEAGTTIRTDNHQSFVSLKMEAEKPSSDLHKFRISIDLGRINCPNKNTIVERTNREVHKEVLRGFAEKEFLTKTDLVMLERQVNSRQKSFNLSPKEVAFRRNFMDNSQHNISDEKISNLQLENRQTQSGYKLSEKAKHQKVPTDQSFNVGDLVVNRSGGNKLHAKHLFIVTELGKNEDTVFARKFERQFRSRQVEFRRAELMRVFDSETFSDILSQSSDSDRPAQAGQAEEKNISTRPPQVEQAALSPLPTEARVEQPVSQTEGAVMGEPVTKSVRKNRRAGNTAKQPSQPPVMNSHSNISDTKNNGNQRGTINVSQSNPGISTRPTRKTKAKASLAWSGLVSQVESKFPYKSNCDISNKNKLNLHSVQPPDSEDEDFTILTIRKFQNEAQQNDDEDNSDDDDENIDDSSGQSDDENNDDTSNDDENDDGQSTETEATSDVTDSEDGGLNSRTNSERVSSDQDSDSPPGSLDNTVIEITPLSASLQAAAAPSASPSQAAGGQAANHSPAAGRANNPEAISLILSPNKITRGFLQKVILDESESVDQEREQNYPLSDQLGAVSLDTPGIFSRKLNLYNSLGKIPEQISDSEDQIELTPSKESQSLFESHSKERILRKGERVDYKKLHEGK